MNATEEDPTEPNLIRRRHAVAGPRQAILVLSLLVGLLLSCLDTAIVSTSLVAISKDLADFLNAPWIILAYLLTYMGFAVCISKISDIYGRRNMLVTSWVLFISFSLGCANAGSMAALIICRGFQGIGASGLYSLTQIGLLEIGPSHKPGLIGAMIGATLAVAFVLGPLIGGVVSQLSSWRWLFNMNIPIGLVAMLTITNIWPNENHALFFSWPAFKCIDFVGAATLLISSTLLVFSIQQGGSQAFAWSSPAIIIPLVISGLSAIIFVVWELRLERNPSRTMDPIFPVKLLTKRKYASGIFVTLLTGFPYVALCIVLPERSQIVDSKDVLSAGLNILPLLGGCAVGSFLGGALSNKHNRTSATIILGSALELAGTSLMTIPPNTGTTKKMFYVYQVIFGLGVGLSFSAVTILTNIVADESNERASGQGAVAQARVLGGCIGLSVCTAVLNESVTREVRNHLTEDQLRKLLRSPLLSLSFSESQLELVRDAYNDAFSKQVKVMLGVCATMAVASLLSLERHPAPLAKISTLLVDRAGSSRKRSESVTELTEVEDASTNEARKVQLH